MSRQRQALAPRVEFVARGYPEPKEPREAKVPRLLPEGTCVICKRRAAQPGSTKCAPCAEALARG